MSRKCAEGARRGGGSDNIALLSGTPETQRMLGTQTCGRHQPPLGAKKAGDDRHFGRETKMGVRSAPGPLQRPSHPSPSSCAPASRMCRHWQECCDKLHCWGGKNSAVRHSPDCLQPHQCSAHRRLHDCAHVETSARPQLSPRTGPKSTSGLRVHL